MAKTFSPAMTLILDAGCVAEAKEIIAKLSGDQEGWKKLNVVEKSLVRNLSIASLKGNMKVSQKQIKWLRRIHDRLYKAKGKP